MDVPDIILNSNFLFSPKILETGVNVDQLAMMSTPGAIKSGYNFTQTKKVNNKYC